MVHRFSLRKLPHLHTKKQYALYASGIVAILILCGGLLLTYTNTHRSANNSPSGQDAKATKAAQTQDGEKLTTTDIVATTKPNESQSATQDTSTERPAETPVTEPTMGITPSGCAGCNSTPEQAGFSISTIGSANVTAGSSVGPFVASTSDGRDALWAFATPMNTPAGAYSPSGSTNRGPSHTFYITAPNSAPAGTYTLMLNALDTRIMKKVGVAISVTVNPIPYFTFAMSPSASSNGSAATVPFTISRFGGHNVPVSVSGQLTCPDSNDAYSETNTSGNSGTLNFNVWEYPAGKTCTLYYTARDAGDKSYYSTTTSVTFR